MSNEYYMRGDAIQPFTLADARQLVAEFTKLEQAFDKLPAQELLNSTSYIGLFGNYSTNFNDAIAKYGVDEIFICDESGQMIIYVRTNTPPGYEAIPAQPFALQDWLETTSAAIIATAQGHSDAAELSAAAALVTLANANDAWDGAVVAEASAVAAVAEADALLTEASAALAAGTVSDLVGTRIYTGRAALDADLVPADGLYALVIGDATAANNDLYRKIGATTVGSWSAPLGLFAAASAEARAAADEAATYLLQRVPDWQTSASLVGPDEGEVGLALQSDVDALATQLPTFEPDWQTGGSVVDPDNREARFAMAADIAPAASAAARATVSPMLDRRDVRHRVAVLGDSRAAAVALDVTYRRILGGLSPFNWANALLGQRMVIAAQLGVSGERSDQIMARLSAAIASGAGTIYIHQGLNDIAQAYPSAGTSGATAAANTIIMANAARAAGMQVVIEAEAGAYNLTQPSVAQVNDLNARLFAFAAATPGVHLHDARRAVLDANAAEATTVYKTGYAYDGVHPSTRGAQAWGRSLAALLGEIIPPRPLPLPSARADAPPNGRWQLARNALFLDASGGSLTAGATGTVPALWSGRITSGSTATFAVAPHADAIGNRMTASAAMTAVNHVLTLSMDILTADYAVGDVVQGYAEVTITDAAALAGVYLLLEQYTGSGGTSIASTSLRAVTGAGHVGPVTGDKLTLATLPYTITANVGAGPWMALSVRADAIGAGSLGFTVDRVSLARIPA